MEYKKIGRWLLVLLFGVCLLTGCKKNVGTPEDNATTTTEESEETEEVIEEGHLIGFSVIDMENPYYVAMEKAARQFVEDSGNRMVTKNPSSNAKTQEKQIQEMIEEGVEVIFLAPVDWEKITPSLEHLQEAGVKIINIDTPVKESSKVDVYIGSDNRKAGYLCGVDLIQRHPEGGKVAILESPNQNSVNERITGFEEAIAKAENGFEVVARADTNGEIEKAIEAAKEILEKNGEITAIMCGNDQLAIAAKSAVNLEGKTDVSIYGIDGSPEIKKEIAKTDSQVIGTVAQSPINMARHGVEIALLMLENQTFEPLVLEDVFLIHRENVDWYGVDGWQ